jgi:hypothetical protein
MKIYYFFHNQIYHLFIYHLMIQLIQEKYNMLFHFTIFNLIIPKYFIYLLLLMDFYLLS